MEQQQSFLGFANIAEQVHRKSVKRGFEFTLMVVGESGLGKSTLVNSIFLSDLYSDRKMPPVEEKLKRTVDIQKTTMEIEEKGVKLRLTVVDTPGFGDSLDGSASWKACLKYVDDQFENYFESESGLNRKNIVDSRVHCCLYFIPPYGHGLRQIDLEFMKRLQYKVNLIPVIAKSDCLTKQEIQRMKDRINTEIEENDIEIYQFPDCDSDEDEDFKARDQILKSSIPFAVIGGTHILEVNGRKLRGRQYPWGFVELENNEHSDFALLRRFLVQTHMQDLKDVTHDVHYENFRVNCLSTLSQQSGGGNGGLTRMTSALTAADLARGGGRAQSGGAANGTKLSGMGRSQEDLISDAQAEQLLREKDDEIKRMQDMIQRMQAQLNHSS